MSTMRSWPLCLLFLLPWSTTDAQKPPEAPGIPPAFSAQAIMARVAANQDRTETERTHYVYIQHARVQSRKGSAVMCEEVTDTRIVPGPKGQTRELLALSGHVREGKRVIRYTVLPSRETAGVQHDETKSDDDKGASVNIGDKETVLDADARNTPVAVNDTDIDLVESMRRSFTSDGGSKDGVSARLFPLTTAVQKNMAFDLKGREPKNGHDTFHIAFRPKDDSDYDWKGDAWIDARDFQPVVVRTALSHNIPLGVRMLLGTSVPGLGFTVIYGPQGGVWFPVSFGSEFNIHVLFAFHRKIVVDVENRSFERTHVTSTIHADEARPVTQPQAEPHP